MKTTKLLILFAVAIIGLSSCSKKLTPFTQSLSEKNGWSENELKQIQFYLSEDIILRREASNSNAEIRDGEIKMVDGRKVEEIKIKKGTPGVLLFKPKEKRMAISFESDDSGDRFLMFGPNPKVGNRYVLLASDWEKRKGKVTYDGRTYFTPTSSAYATLLVDLKRARKLSLKSRTAKGRTVGD